MGDRDGQDWLSRPINNIKIPWYWLWFTRQYQYSSNALYKININIKISWYWFILPNQYQYFSNDLFNIKININIYCVVSQYTKIKILISIFLQFLIQYQYQDQYSTNSLLNINIKINIFWTPYWTSISISRNLDIDFPYLININIIVNS